MGLSVAALLRLILSLLPGTHALLLPPSPPLPPPPSRLSLASVLSDHAVLPAAGAIIWGWAPPHSAVHVELSGAHSGSYTATAGAVDGTWEVDLPTLPAGLGLSNITVSSGSAVLTMRSVLFGQLILCGGQSNMQFSLNTAFNASTYIASAADFATNLRLLTVRRTTSAAPATDVSLSQPWSVSSPSAVDDKHAFGLFSAECFLTGRRLLQMRPGVPIGLISSCWSGSMIQPWMSPQALAACPAAVAKGSKPPFQDSMMFNAMIEPLKRLKLAAVLFHQGEENSGNPVEYKCFFRSMIKQWRDTFAMPALPFSFVQLQPCGIPPAQRYAQAAALSLTNVGMATAVDLLDPGAPQTKPCPQPSPDQDPACLNPNGMCHSRWKAEVAERLAAVTARMVFSATELAAAAPTLPPLSPTVGHFLSMRSKDYRTYEVVLSIDHAENVTSLATHGTKECSLCCNAPGFAVEYSSNAPGVHWAALGTVPDKHGVPLSFNPLNKTVTLTLVVEPPFQPVAVRYAWQDAPQCMLFTRPGNMPVPPFNISFTRE
jgi:hypothetical protein